MTVAFRFWWPKSTGGTKTPDFHEVEPAAIRTHPTANRQVTFHLQGSPELRYRDPIYQPAPQS